MLVAFHAQELWPSKLTRGEFIDSKCFGGGGCPGVVGRPLCDPGGDTRFTGHHAHHSSGVRLPPLRARFGGIHAGRHVPPTHRRRPRRLRLLAPASKRRRRSVHRPLLSNIKRPPSPSTHPSLRGRISVMISIDDLLNLPLPGISPPTATPGVTTDSHEDATSHRAPKPAQTHGA